MWVRCPGRDAPFFSEATELVRRIIMQRDVEIEVETVDIFGTVLGSLLVSESNVAVTLLEHGLAKLQTSFNTDKIKKFHQLAHAEQSSKRQKLKLFGGNALALQSGDSFQGDNNIFLLGDPGNNKSQLMTYTHKLSPSGIQTSGRGSSVVGLTAYVAKDPESSDKICL
ncbi:hypothetical protein AgCh_005884 [Apium graveolens]